MTRGFYFRKAASVLAIMCVLAFSACASNVPNAAQVGYQFATDTEGQTPSLGVSVTNVIEGAIGYSAFNISQPFDKDPCVRSSAEKMKESFQSNSRVIEKSNSIDSELSLGGSAWGVKMSTSSKMSMSQSYTGYIHKVTYAVQKSKVYSVNTCPFSNDLLQIYSKGKPEENTDKWISQFGTGFVREVTAGCMGLIEVVYEFSDKQSQSAFESEVKAQRGDMFNSQAKLAWEKQDGEKNIKMSGSCEFVGMGIETCDFASLVDISTGEVKFEQIMSKVQGGTCDLSNAKVLSASTSGWANVAQASGLRLNLDLLQYNVSEFDMSRFKNDLYVIAQVTKDLEDCINTESQKVVPKCYNRAFYHDNTEEMFNKFDQLQKKAIEMNSRISSQEYKGLSTDLINMYNENVTAIAREHYLFRQTSTPIEVVMDYLISDCSFNYGVLMKNVTVDMFQMTNQEDGYLPPMFKDDLTTRLGSEDKGRYGLEGFSLTESFEGPFIPIPEAPRPLSQDTQLPKTYQFSLTNPTNKNIRCSAEVTIKSITSRSNDSPKLKRQANANGAVVRVSSTTGGDKYKSLNLSSSDSAPKLFNFTMDEEFNFEQVISSLPPQTALFVYRRDFGNENFQLNPNFRILSGKRDSDGYHNVFFIGNGSKTQAISGKTIGSLLKPWAHALYMSGGRDRILAAAMMPDMYSLSSYAFKSNPGVPNLFFKCTSVGCANY
eukprot:Nk52_evm49s210 gene=Nk52_evmTU49s210